VITLFCYSFTPTGEGGQVRALRLEDINWEQNQILFKALKHGKDSHLPLTLKWAKAS